MKKILVTQRLDVIAAYNERRSSLDNRWFDFLDHVGLEAVLVPNHPSSVGKYLRKSIDGLLLTGGGSAPERDETEALLLEHCLRERIPVLGVCRGMQLIQKHFGAELMKIENHVAVRHQIIRLNSRSKFFVELQSLKDVNSYHDYGSRSSGNGLLVCASSPDGIIEAIEHPEQAIWGQMWHPERETVFTSADSNIFKNFF